MAWRRSANVEPNEVQKILQLQVSTPEGPAALLIYKAIDLTSAVSRPLKRTGYKVTNDSLTSKMKAESVAHPGGSLFFKTLYSVLDTVSHQNEN